MVSEDDGGDSNDDTDGVGQEESGLEAGEDADVLHDSNGRY